jgi:hypothetical protein
MSGAVARQLLAAILLSVCLAAVGCSSSEMPTVPVSGRVTFAGGPPPARGSITFMPHSGSNPAGLPSKPGSAQFETDGRFVVTSFEQGDGLLPGTYGVSVSCIKDYQNLSSNPDAVAVRDYVPQNYRPEDLVVKEGQDAIEVTYDVPPKKES